MSLQYASQSRGISTQPRRADHTFNDYRDADVILRASDGKDIYSHKWMLSRISPVFRTMFELPQGNVKHEDRFVHSVDISEPGETLVNLLSFAYPDLRNPTIETVEKCRNLIEAALKYDIGRLGEILRAIASKTALYMRDPITSCALSLRYDIDGIREYALYQLKYRKTSLVGNPTVLRLLQEGHLSAIEHYQLLVEYRDAPGSMEREEDESEDEL